jgi:hypothetical protein
VTRPPPDPARGAEAARKLKSLGVKGILIKAAELGYITQVTCRMPECFCPEELGGARYFEPVTEELSDWMPTHEHFPISKREGGRESPDNAVLAHRLCNRIDYSITAGRSYASDLERVRKAREAAAATVTTPPTAPTDATTAVPRLDVAVLRAEGFAGFFSFDELRSGALDGVPQAAGVYVVIREEMERPSFLESSPGGRFKGKDPTESVEVLDAKWVDGAEVIYIGKGENLRRRLKQYADFGAGGPIGHWGGRYIWQLADVDRLVVGWRACGANETAGEAESTLVRRFKKPFGRLPFANIADPSR